MNAILWLDEKTKENANEFIHELENGEFIVDMLPNTEDDFLGEKAQYDYMKFDKLLGTKYLTSVLNIQTDEVGTAALCAMEKR